MAKRIVVCGVDQALVETRVAILVREGHDVCGSTVASVARQMVEPREADLLILCSSLAPDEQRRLLGISHNLRPGQKSLIVTPAYSQSVSSSSIDIPFTAFDGPRRFVTQVNSLLAV